MNKTAKTRGTAERKPLCLMCFRGPVGSIHHPSRLKEYVHFSDEESIVVIEPLLLSIGVFVGRARPCHVRLDELESTSPAVAIRYDRSLQWTMTGLASFVRVNGQFLDGRTITLSIGDRIQIPPYDFVVSDPRDIGVARVMATDDKDNEEPIEVIEEPEFSNTTFELQMPDFPNN